MLTPDQVREIFRLYRESGVKNMSELARRFNVRRETIWSTIGERTEKASRIAAELAKPAN